jgi:hypothetical protein
MPAKYYVGVQNLFWTSGTQRWISGERLSYDTMLTFNVMSMLRSFSRGSEYN